jgi:putative aldouronate transport system permease protein
MASYNFVFFHSDQVIRAYVLTILVTAVGSVSSLLVIALLAYPLSRRDFKFRKFFTFFVFFTMLFSGGFVPWYIVCVQLLHLRDTILALILPYLVNAWYVIIMKTFYTLTIPESILESARIDGAGEFKTFFTIVIPLAVPALATIGLFRILTYWNDWWLPLTLINNEKLYNLQYLMYRVELNVQFLKSAMTKMGSSAAREVLEIPSESARMAMCIISIGPIILAYPFLQKYFVKGLTIGAVKG